jgi:hypothetical protein
MQAPSLPMHEGGQYGLHLLWLLVVLLPRYDFVQEMVARLGIATGKGHASMIYERFGKWWGRFSLIDDAIVQTCMRAEMTAAGRNNEAIERVVIRLLIEDEVSTLSWSVVGSAME